MTDDELRQVIAYLRAEATVCATRAREAGAARLLQRCAAQSAAADALLDAARGVERGDHLVEWDRA
jgi:hypothetical protein